MTADRSEIAEPSACARSHRGENSARCAMQTVHRILRGKYAVASIRRSERDRMER